MTYLAYTLTQHEPNDLRVSLTFPPFAAYTATS